MIDTAMHVGVWPDAMTADAGGVALVSVVVTNLTELIDAYSVEVLGVDPEWIEASLDRVSLFPTESQQVDLTIRVPPGYPAADRLLTLAVVSLNDTERFVLTPVTLTIPAVASTTIELDPLMVSGGRSADFGVAVANAGNAPVRAIPFAVDPEERARFRFEPAELIVAPGQTEIVHVNAKGGRAWFGNPRPRAFSLGVDAEQRIEQPATFIQRPRIPRWSMTLLGLLAAATVFAIVLSRTFDKVVEEASVGDDVLDEALSNGDAGGARVPSNPGTVSGVLTTSTNRQLAVDGAAGFQATSAQPALGVAAVQIELFEDTDPTSPLATAASDDEGKFTLANLGKGKYLLHMSGAGYPDVWFAQGGAGVSNPADATVIEVALGLPTDLGEIQVGGIPVTIEGSVGGDAAGATLKLVRTGVLDPGVPALLAEVEIGADGSFTLPDIPSPADLDMIVEKPGFATVLRKVTLQPGDALGDISIQLTPAEGKVEGRVVEPGGPLGGVTITATDGRHTIETVSYTEGDVGGFTLRNLSIPGRYTVTAHKDGFVPETRTVTLETGQSVVQLPDLSLVPATGRVSGSVRVEGRASGDVMITLTGGAGIERDARPVSGDGPSAGTFLIDGLPSPGTYTLTFASDEVLTQVRVVALDPANGLSEANVGLVDLRLERRTVRGTVVEAGTRIPIGLSEVVLNDGTTTRTVLSANSPSGAFAFSNVPAGDYTLTANREGAFATVVPITVEAGTDLSGVTLTLARQASIVGTVDTGGVACDLVVRLFEFGDFDSGSPRETELAGGEFEFLAVRAPVGYLVAIYTRGATEPLATTSVASAPSSEVVVPVVDVAAACRSLVAS